MKKSLEDLRHARSEKDFPFLSLEEGEFVELVITRSKIYLLFVWFFTIVTLLLLTLCIFILPSSFEDSLGLFKNFNMTNIFAFAMFILYIIILTVGLIGTKIHFGNKLFITNKRAIQLTVSGLFSSSTNVVELSRIEDVSFKQTGLIQTALHYGTIRMSTVGDETTYTFPFVDTPTDEIQTISHLVYEIKNKD